MKNSDSNGEKAIGGESEYQRQAARQRSGIGSIERVASTSWLFQQQ